MSGKDLLQYPEELVGLSIWADRLKGSKRWTFPDNVRIVDLEIEEGLVLEVVSVRRNKDSVKIKAKISNLNEQ